MKKLLTIAVLMLSINSFAGVVECGNLKDGAKRFYPVNKLALSIAADLNVVTCNGERFQDAIKEGKHTKTAVRITKQQMLKLRKSLAIKKNSF